MKDTLSWKIVQEQNNRTTAKCFDVRNDAHSRDTRLNETLDRRNMASAHPTGPDSPPRDFVPAMAVLVWQQSPGKNEWH